MPRESKAPHAVSYQTAAPAVNYHISVNPVYVSAAPCFSWLALLKSYVVGLADCGAFGYYSETMPNRKTWLGTYLATS